MGSTVSLVAGDSVDRGPEEEEEVGGGLLWRLQLLGLISTQYWTLLGLWTSPRILLVDSTEMDCHLRVLFY